MRESHKCKFELPPFRNRHLKQEPRHTIPRNSGLRDNCGVFLKSSGCCYSGRLWQVLKIRKSLRSFPTILTQTRKKKSAGPRHAPRRFCHESKTRPTKSCASTRSLRELGGPETALGQSGCRRLFYFAPPVRDSTLIGDRPAFRNSEFVATMSLVLISCQFDNC